MKFIHKLRKISDHSYSIVIPKTLVKKFGWKEKQKIVLEEKPRKRLELRDFRSK